MKKRVLIIAYYWPPAGGGGVQRWLKFVKYLHNSDWQPVVFVPENADYPVYDETLLSEIPEGVEVIRCPIFEPYRALRKATGKGDAGISAGFIRSGKGPSFMERLMAWVRGNILIPDARMFWIRPASNFLLKYLKENPVDMIVSTGPPHSMHLIARRVHRKTGVSWLADFRDPWVNMDNADKFQMSAWAKRKHERLERSVLRSATAVQTVGWYLSAEYEKIRGGEVKVLTNGFDHIDFEGREVVPTDKFIVGHYGTFGDDRNAPALWRALGAVPEAELWVAGAALSRRDRWMMAAAGVGSRVRVLGEVDDLVPVYRQATWFVHPTLYDACANTVLQSMACGLPGIISAADGASEFIRDGENGLLLAQPGDPVLLGDLLQRALRYAPAERAAMGRAARTTVLPLTWNAHVAAWESLCQKLQQPPERGRRQLPGPLHPPGQ